MSSHARGKMALHIPDKSYICSHALVEREKLQIQRKKRSRSNNRSLKSESSQPSNKSPPSNHQNMTLVSSYQCDQDSQDIIQRQYQNFKDLSIAQATLLASLSHKSDKDNNDDHHKVEYLSMLSVTNLDSNQLLSTSSPKAWHRLGAPGSHQLP